MTDPRIILMDNGQIVAVVNNGQAIPASNRDHAQDILTAVDTAFTLGQRSARTQIRQALGIRAWGRDLSCTDG